MKRTQIIPSHVMVLFPITLEKDLYGEGGYTVTCPELPGCISEGDNIYDAKNNIEEAIELYIKAMVEESRRKNK